MQRINALYSKRVINVATGDPVATVRDVVLSDDVRRIVALLVSEGGRGGDEQVIPWESVISVGEFVIADGRQAWQTLADHPDVANLREQAHQITGKPIMSATGERLGTVSDILYDERGQLVSYELKQGGLFGGSSDAPMLPASSVQAIGKDAIIATNSELITRDELEPAANEPVSAPEQMDEQVQEQGGSRVRVYTRPTNEA